MKYALLCHNRYTKTGQLAISGFCDPHKDPTEEEVRLWMPDPDNPPRDLDLAQARFLLAKVADQFCDLFVQEKMATPENMAESKFPFVFSHLDCLNVTLNFFS